MGAIRGNQTERFWAGVDKTGDCWLWQRAILNSGYGSFRQAEPVRKMVTAHRFAYELEHGPLGAALIIDHICRVRHCVRPSHMRAVTIKQNGEHRSATSTRARSGVRGVVWNGTLGKWMSQVRHNGKLYIGGYFGAIEEAATDVALLRNRLYTHNDLDRP